MSEQQPAADTSSAFSLDTVHGLLAHHRRRSVLTELEEHGSIALAALADEVACREQGASITEIPEEDVLTVYSSLWHAHIPKLAEAGAVEYDQDMDIVRLSENAEQIIHVLHQDAQASEETT